MSHRVDILGVKIDAVTFNQALTQIEQFVKDGRKHLVVTPYAESIIAAQTDTEFRGILNGADLAVPDGGSLLAAAKFLQIANGQWPIDNSRDEAASTCHSSERWNPESGGFRLSPEVNRLGRNDKVHRYDVVQIANFQWWKFIFCGLKVGLALMFNRKYLDVLPETVTGTDLTAALCELAAKNGWKVFFLGGWKGAAEKAASTVKKKYPGLIIESFEGSQRINKETSEEHKAVRERLAAFSPDLLFVAYGPVTQEKWLAKNLPELPVKVAIGVAGAFDMIAGLKPRAPSGMRKAGLEWLWRLLIEPARWRRIFTATVIFPLRVFSSAVNINTAPGRCNLHLPGERE